jgi:hypothetical protein
VRADDLSVERLARLAEKYRVLAELRARREALQAGGAQRFDAREARSRRSAFRRVAKEFPGALRELDATPAEVLRARHAIAGEAHRATSAGEPYPLPLWLELADAYHRELREALAIKHWLARRLPRGGTVDESIQRAFRGWYARLAFRQREAPELSAAELAHYLSPPGGRVQGVVWEHMEARFGRTHAELERLLFGSSPLSR